MISNPITLSISSENASYFKHPSCTTTFPTSTTMQITLPEEVTKDAAKFIWSAIGYSSYNSSYLTSTTTEWIIGVVMAPIEYWDRNDWWAALEFRLSKSGSDKNVNWNGCNNRILCQWTGNTLTVQPNTTVGYTEEFFMYTKPTYWSTYVFY